MPKKIATLLLSIAAIGSIALPVQAATTANSSSNSTDCKSNLIAQGTKLNPSVERRRNECIRLRADCLKKSRIFCRSFQQKCGLGAGAARRR
jgi:hypothetical protein